VVSVGTSWVTTPTSGDVLTELGRDALPNVQDAIAVFAAIARTNPRAKRDLVHFKISPGHEFSEAEFAQTIAMIEIEFEISARAYPCRLDGNI
jgi:hypothetical protein